ncbi:antitermination protein Q, partial [Shigella flexneri]|nr:antitermination protein Q [Shigella flexneri]EFX5489840.1 antitermination protein Q [Shigella flexneri]EFY9795899.1 antitermination protein Q [Shigella flexneri]EFZ8852112.1 antitermination protein Q [Shigella flexneri]HBD6215260.1 antitermination protein Q [Shigella flexneri]
LLKKRTNGSVRYCQYTSPLRYKRASSPLVDDNSNADKTRPPH